MPTRNVVLTDHHEKLLAGLVACGRYQNASEVLRDGLRLVEQRDAADAARLEALRSAVQVGFDDFDRGDYTEFANGSELSAHLDRLAELAFSGKAID